MVGTHSDSFKREAPSSEKLDRFLAKGSSIGFNETNRPSGSSPKNYLELDYLSPRDISDNWNLIDCGKSIRLHTAMNLDISGHSSRTGNYNGCIYYPCFGMKDPNSFMQYMFLLIMCGGITSPKGDPIDDNLNYTRDNRSSNFIKDRIISPAYSNCSGKEWLVDHRESIHSHTKKYKAHTFVIHEPTVSIHDAGYAETCKKNWEATLERLTHLTRLKGFVAMTWHRELAFSSLLTGTLDPHTHVILWWGEDFSIDSIKASMKLDKWVSYDPSSGWTKRDIGRLEGYYRYLSSVYSPHKVYSRDWSPDSSRTVNINLREMLWASKEIFSGVRKVGSNNLPTRNTLLQIKEKKAKIKETKSAPKESRRDESRISKRNVKLPRGEQNLQRGKHRNTRRTREEPLWEDSIRKLGEEWRASLPAGRRIRELQEGLQECYARERSG